MICSHNAAQPSCFPGSPSVVAAEADAAVYVDLAPAGLGHASWDSLPGYGINLSRAASGLAVPGLCHIMGLQGI